MPRIPLSDIPNAPQVVQQPTGANLSGVNLGRAETLLQRPQISAGAFDGPARGMQALASGIAGASQDVAAAATHIREQQDNNTVWKFSNALEQAYNSVAANIAANPTRPEEYASKMQKGLDDSYQQFLAAEKPSRSAMPRIQQLYGKYQTDSIGRMRIAGAKALFDQNKGFAKDAYDRAVEDGNTAKAIDVINQNRGKLFFDQEADGLIHNANEKGDTLRVLQTSQSDPDAAQAILDDHKQTPHIPEIQRLRLASQIDTDRRRIKAENWEALVSGIANRTISTPEDVANIFGEKFAAENAPQIKAVFAANPDPVKQKQSWVSIKEDIAKIDPSDSKNAEDAAYDIRKRISSEIADTGVRDSLRAELKGLFSRNPESLLRSQMSSMLATATAGFVFGRWDEDAIKKGNSDEVAKKNSAIAVKYRVQRDGEEWIKKNPNASSDQLQEWFNRRMSREIKQTEPGWWGRHAPTWLGGVPTVTPEPASLGTRIDDELKKHSK